MLNMYINNITCIFSISHSLCFYLWWYLVLVGKTTWKDCGYSTDIQAMNDIDVSGVSPGCLAVYACSGDGLGIHYIALVILVVLM